LILAGRASLTRVPGFAVLHGSAAVVAVCSSSAMCGNIAGAVVGVMVRTTRRTSRADISIAGRLVPPRWTVVALLADATIVVAVATICQLTAKRRYVAGAVVGPHIAFSAFTAVHAATHAVVAVCS
jgi:hypothetical protein